MKNQKISIKTIAIIVLIGIIISFILIILNIKNQNILRQEIAKEQLGETTGDNAYVSMETHLSELSAKQQELDNVQNTAGQATVTADKILKDYTAYKDGKLITGTMANNGAVTKSLSVGGSYTIPAGYHNGSGKVTNAVTNKGTLTLGSTNSTAVDITDGYYTHVNTTAVYNTGYNQGINDSKTNLKTQTVSSTFTLEKAYTGYDCTFTFDTLTEVVGLSSYTTGDAWVTVRNISKSGNSITIGFQSLMYNERGGTFTVTAIGY